jgi:hypothetical protein
LNIRGLLVKEMRITKPTSQKLDRLAALEKLLYSEEAMKSRETLPGRKPEDIAKGSYVETLWEERDNLRESLGDLMKDFLPRFNRLIAAGLIQVTAIDHDVCDDHPVFINHTYVGEADITPWNTIGIYADLDHDSDSCDCDEDDDDGSCGDPDCFCHEE